MTPELAVGTWLGGYRLDRVIGEGGMGIVWEAHDPDLDRAIAVKVLRHAEAATTLRRRLLREARAMARLKHPNVLTVYEVGTEGDRDYIAMELVDGDNLDRWLATKPPVELVWTALFGAGRGLAAAHAAGLVHRDFKPHNVLRSLDGRVLVTDFGLARGLGEVLELPELPVRPAPQPAGALDATLELPKSPVPMTDATLEAPTRPTPTPNAITRRDSVLDSTLTQTGALIGTPAYMAPELFDGATPNPRTDQYAYCVTAWQALAGKRPFAATTIEEMRDAARAGVGDRGDGLAKPVRAVLARGLDPDPTKRWPDLDRLLHALERARARPRRRWFAGAVIAILAALALYNITSHDPDPVTQVLVKDCEPGDHAFAQAWSDARRATIVKYGAASERLASAFDDVRRRWLASYQQACAKADEPHFHARLGCLLGARDDIEVRAELVGTLERADVEHFDTYGFFPNLAICDGPAPVAPPELPKDPAMRRRVLDLRGALLGARRDPDTLARAAERVLALDSWDLWEPLQAEAIAALADAEQRRGHHTAAREHYERALSLANGIGFAQIVALASVGLLEVEISQLADPGSTGGIDRATERARAAIKRAGDDPDLLEVYNLLLARTQIVRVERDADEEEDDDWGEFAHLMSSIGPLAAATDGNRRTREAIALIVEVVARLGSDALEQMRGYYQKPLGDRELDELIARIAWLDHDLAEVHRRHDAHATAKAIGTRIHGTVVGSDGKPAVGARVVAWSGELVGDGDRLYVDRDAVTGDVAIAGADGGFDLAVPDGGAIAAELGEQRSVPVVAQAGIAVKLAQTRVLTGTYPLGGRHDRDVFVRYRAGANSLAIATPRGDGDYTLRRLPPGGRLGAIGRTGPASTRRLVANAWPHGATLDVIVRGGAQAVTRDVYVFRQQPPARRRSAVAQLARDLDDVSWGTWGPIGADATSAGRRDYRRTDEHVVFQGISGEVVICAIARPEANAPAVCVPATVPATATSFAAVIELR